MKVSFLYDEKALTDYQLYIAAHSPVVIKTRIRNRWLLSLIYIAIGVFGIFKGDLMFTIMFIVIGILWYIFYPMWGGRYYKKNYVKFVKANYKNRFGKSVDLDFQDDQVEITEAGQTASFAYAEFSSIVEISSAFLIQLKQDMVILLDKKATIPSDEIAAYLKNIADSKQIDYIDNTQWKWK